MKRTASVLMVLGVLGSLHAAAEEDVVDKAGKGIKKGGEAAGRGIEKGLDATGRGIRKGAAASGKGVKKGLDATGKGLEKAGKWIDEKTHRESGDK